MLAKAPKCREPDKRSAGRPTEFKAEYSEQVVMLCRLGATDRQIGDFFGVSERTINSWKRQHPAFLQSIKEGKTEADMLVANALFKNATGYVVETEKVVGRGDAACVHKVKVNVPGDTVAQIFWLKNRQREHWRDKSETGVTDADGKAVVPVLNIGLARNK